MKRPVVIQSEYDQIGTIQDLSSVFEGIASMHIAKIKDKVVSSTAFFHELWDIYAQLRVDPQERIGVKAGQGSGRPALLMITSQGGLIGDIDERIVKALMKEKLSEADVYVIGAHGAALLAQRGVHPKQIFALPEEDHNIAVTPIIDIVKRYGRVSVYYQTYVSLTRQEIVKMDLFSAVAALSQTSGAAEKDVISSRDYVFEPSLKEITAYMESVMLEVALGQVILESRLAQYASRFNAMNAAHTKAKELRSDLGSELSRAKRAQGDERTKEILSTLRTGGSRG